MPVTNYHTLNGELLGETGPGGRRFYGKDALGSVVATYDQNGTLENTYRYKPYGGLLSKTGSAPDPRFMWTGSTGSRTTGANYAEQYNRARHYGSRQAGWTSVDPLWPDQPAYGYVRGNPINRLDSLGFLDTDQVLNECLNITILVAFYCTYSKRGSGTALFKKTYAWCESDRGCDNCEDVIFNCSVHLQARGDVKGYGGRNGIRGGFGTIEMQKSTCKGQNLLDALLSIAATPIVSELLTLVELNMKEFGKGDLYVDCRAQADLWGTHMKPADGGLLNCNPGPCNNTCLDWYKVLPRPPGAPIWPECHSRSKRR